MAKNPVVIVTGSSGLIGFPLCERLSQDFTVVGFDREGPPHPPQHVEVETVDLTSDDSVRTALENVRRRHGHDIASVIHLAAYYDFGGRPSPLYEKLTVQGTARLLRELKTFNVGQFVFSSTMLVHAPCRPGERISEESPLEPKWAYPESKVKTEKLLFAERGNVPVVNQRIAGVYADDCRSIPIAHQIQRIYEKSITGRVYPGEVSHGQAFIHLDDLLDAMEATVRKRTQLPPETVMLLGEPETIPYGELQKILARLIHGTDWTTWRIPKIVAKIGAWVQDKLPLFGDPFIKPWMIDLADDHYALDIRRAKTLLGWSPKRSLRDTLPKMTRALKEDPEGWYKTNKLKKGQL
jgi:nucleoside-diphosphate-sugar epimerase